MSTTSTSQSQGIDVERLVLMPIFVLLLVVNVMGLWSLQDEPLTRSNGLGAAHDLVITAFYVLLVGLLLFRRPSRSTTRSTRAVVAAYAGTFAPFLLVLQPRSAAPDWLLLTSTTMMVVGLTFTLFSLTWLGRSFGVVPAARVLVRTGPYRWIRHPLYTGEFVTFLGAILVALSPFTVMVFAGGVSVQVYRAFQEEKLLKTVFPEYDAYMAKTTRFVPHVI